MCGRSIWAKFTASTIHVHVLTFLGFYNFTVKILKSFHTFVKMLGSFSKALGILQAFLRNYVHNNSLN